MKMCSAISANGCFVDLIVPNGKEEKEAVELSAFDFYGVNHKFSIHSVRWSRAGQFGYGFEAAKMAARSKADIVYCRNVYAAIYSVLMGLKTVLELHAPPSQRTGLLRSVQNFLLRCLFSSERLVKLVVITHKLKDHMLAEWNLREEKLLVAPDGADEYGAPIEPKVVGERVKVGYTGQLYPGKGMEIILPLARRCPWADFVVVGGKEEDLAYWKEKAAGIDNLCFAGYVPHSEVAKYIEEFDVVLLPNQEKVLTYGADQDIGQWTSPLKAFEYMAAGKPVLVSDLPVLKEIFTHGCDALLCKSDDVGEWEAALRKLHEDSGLRKSLGDNAKMKLMREYTWKVRAKNIVDSLREHIEVAHQ